MTIRAHTVVPVLHRFAAARGVIEGENQLELFVEDLLFGEHALWEAYRGGIVTSDEVVDALLDRFFTRTFGLRDAVTSPPREGEEWTALRAEVRSKLFGDA